MKEHNYDNCHNYTCRKKCEKNGYINAIDDAIEKFLEYGCVCVEWNSGLSKEKLVDDVLRQAIGQVVIILEKMKNEQKEHICRRIELKTCPFCGGDAKLEEIDYDPNWRPTFYDPDSGGDAPVYIVKCESCESVIKYRYDKESAIEAWNRRT